MRRATSVNPHQFRKLLAGDCADASEVKTACKQNRRWALGYMNFDSTKAKCDSTKPGENRDVVRSWPEESLGRRHSLQCGTRANIGGEASVCRVRWADHLLHWWRDGVCRWRATVTLRAIRLCYVSTTTWEGPDWPRCGTSSTVAGEESQRMSESTNKPGVDVSEGRGSRSWPSAGSAARGRLATAARRGFCLLACAGRKSRDSRRLWRPMARRGPARRHLCVLTDNNPSWILHVVLLLLRLCCLRPMTTTDDKSVLFGVAAHV